MLLSSEKMNNASGLKKIDVQKSMAMTTRVPISDYLVLLNIIAPGTKYTYTGCDVLSFLFVIPIILAEVECGASPKQ